MNKTNKPMISIGIPSRGTMRTRTGVCMAMLHGHNLERFGYSKIHYGFGRTESNRNNLSKLAIESGSSHILMIDTDMVFPHDAAETLFNADKDIIGCNAAITNEMSETCGSPVIINRLDGSPIDYKNEVDEVGVIGMALTLIKTEVFLDMCLPWFCAPPRPGETNVMSEDIAFCHAARKEGFKVYCHNKLSERIGHIGDKTRYIFDSDDSGLLKQLAEAQEAIKILQGHAIILNNR